MGPSGAPPLWLGQRSSGGNVEARLRTSHAQPSDAPGKDRRRDGNSVARQLTRLQRMAGNQAVARGLDRMRMVTPQDAINLHVQRCGPVPCDCSREQRAEYERHEADSPIAQRALPVHADPQGFSAGASRSVSRRPTKDQQAPDPEKSESTALTSDCLAGEQVLQDVAVGRDRLVRGRHGTAVSAVQETLIEAGETVGPTEVDGKYGANTEAAVLSFKTKRNIRRDADGVLDGIVGRKTIHAMDKLPPYWCHEHDPPVDDKRQPPKDDSDPPPDDRRTPPPLRPPACPPVWEGEVRVAATKAITLISGAVAETRQRPLKDNVKLGLWKYFRDDSPDMADGAANRLSQMADGLPKVRIACESALNPLDLAMCTDNDNGQTKAYTIPWAHSITVCKSWRGQDKDSRVRILIHEAAHSENPTDLGTAEKYGDCVYEGNYLRETPTFRIDNPDCLSCYVMALTENVDNLERRVRTSRGDSAVLFQSSPGPINLNDNRENRPRFSLSPTAGLDARDVRWTLEDEDGGTYSTKWQGRIFGPGVANGALEDVEIPVSERRVLRQRGVREGSISVTFDVPSAGSQFRFHDLSFVRG